MDNGVLIAMVGGGSAIMGAALTGLVNRLSSKESAAGAMLATMATRQTAQEHTIGELQEQVGHAINDVAKWQEKWSSDVEKWEKRWREERDAKHTIQSEFQAKVLEYEMTIGSLKQQHSEAMVSLSYKHTEEMSKLSHECEREVTSVTERVRELERHVARLENVSNDDGA